jgi:TIR domain
MTGSRIFLSYRRDDSSGHTELLYIRLAGYFGQAKVFRDVHDIQPMELFRDRIQAALSDSAIVLVVISRQWSHLTGKDGGRRLQQSDDWVTWEIANAFALNLPVLPVLVGGATMPAPALAQCSQEPGCVGIRRQEGHLGFRKAAGQREGLAELMVFYCERAAGFAREYGMDDPGYLDALVRMFEQALKVSVTLADAERDAMVNRLDAVRVASRDFGYGVGYNIPKLLAKYRRK